MTPKMKLFLTVIIITVGSVLLTGCQNTLTILDGATHACGTIHIDGWLTDSRGDVRVMKLPTEWDAQEVNQFCPQ